MAEVLLAACPSRPFVGIAAVALRFRSSRERPLHAAAEVAHTAVVRFLGRVFSAALALNAALTRSRLRWVEAALLTPLFVKVTFWVRGRRAVAPQPEALAKEWERLLGGTGAARLVEVTPDTAYGEIRLHCPLRGTGDVAACHRLMAYDRRLLGRLGGQLIVLRSQAEAGQTTCRVAIRPLEAPADDLVPAHQRG